MSTTTLTPASDNSLGGFIVLPSGTAAAALADSSDTTFTEDDASNGGDTLDMNLSANPGDLDTYTAGTVNLRAKGGPGDAFTFRVYKSDGTTAITALCTINITNAGSFNAYTGSLTISDGAAASWSGARIKMSDTGSDVIDASKLSLAMTYTATGGGPIIGVDPVGASGFVGSAARRARRVEGVRFRYD